MQYSKTVKKRFFEKLYLIIDVMVVAFAFVSSYGIKKYLLPAGLSGLSILPNYYILLAQVMVGWIFADMLVSPYRSFFKKRFLRVLSDNIKMVSLVVSFIIITSFLFKTETSRILLLIFFLLSLSLLMIGKCMLASLYKSYFKREGNIYNVIIVGSRTRARSVIDHIQNYFKHYRILGCLDTNDGLIGSEVKNGVKVIGSLENIKEIILNNTVDEVIFAMPLEKIESVDMFILLIEMLGIPVRIFPDWYIHSTVFKPGISKVAFDNFKGSPTMVLTVINQNQMALLAKNIFDISTAFVMLIILFPLFIIVSLLIKIFSKEGPVFFKQDRIGRNGRTFTLYKFRTMVPDAEKRLNDLLALNESDGPAFKMANDPRIIPYIGKLLRKTSMDELPQLINVLKGHMSLVGPRPPLQSEVNQYNIWQRRRLSMKPGLTCLWQIKPNRNDISFNEWMTLDLNYIDRWSLKLDFSILLQTAVVVFGGQGR